MCVSQVNRFKVGDVVRILPSAVTIGVCESEVGKVVEVRSICSSNEIMVYDSRGKDYGCWCVSDYDIAIATIPGQQLLLWDWV